jgi:hypothetical protein
MKNILQRNKRKLRFTKQYLVTKRDEIKQKGEMDRDVYCVSLRFT